MVTQINSPWTAKGRNLAIQKGVAGVYADYFAKGPRWVAKQLNQRSEMREWSGRVSRETTEMLLGDYGSETFVDDDSKMAILASGDWV